jgi:tetratricopeptide (TPR) repeat protein
MARERIQFSGKTSGPSLTMPGVCIDEHLLLAFLAGNLVAPARASVEEHLARCSACADLATWAAAEIAHPSRAPGGEGHAFVGAMVPGARVGRYRILEPVGRGGMGDVYAAYHPDLDRRIALKVVAAAGVATGERRQRLLREARAIARLSHPNVVTVHDAGTIGERVFIVMEFIDGVTLEAWLRAAPRGWQEVLEVFIAAGRGLVAAHAAGVIHRDYKPQNVMIAKDGSVRVMDFGLARLGMETDPPEASSDPGAAIPETVTKTGAVLGTPAYMAPEQFRGEVPDARADQFSFCVALHEALYGARPALAHIEDAGTRSSPPVARRTGVPVWLDAIVARGLAPAPDDRHGSMAALLAALERGRTRVRRRAAIASGIALVLLLTFAGWRVARGSQITCTVPQHRIAAAWSPERRAAVQNVFTSSGRAGAETGWQRLAATLDAYMTEWGAMYTQACEATHARGEQSGEVLDLRMSCLNDNLEQVRALTDAITADAQAASHAVTAAMNLTPISRCADVALLRTAVPLPRDERTLQAVLRLRQVLADSEAMRQMASPVLALAKAVAIRNEVEATGYKPLLGQLLAEIGQIQASLLSTDSERTLEDAVYVAESVRDDLSVAKAAGALVYVAGHLMGKRAEGERWARLAAAVLDRLPDGYESSRLRSWLLNDRAAMLWAHGEYIESEALMRQAIALKEHLVGRNHPDLAVSLSGLGAGLVESGKPEEALPFIERAEAIYRTQPDPDSAQLGRAITNRADALRALGRLPEAVSVYQEAILLLQRTPLQMEGYLAEATVGLGQTELEAGHVRNALGYLEHAFKLVTKISYPSRGVASVEISLARALWEGGGDRDRALALARAARQVFVNNGSARSLREADAWLASVSSSVEKPRDRR